jgi:hypothetical protein
MWAACPFGIVRLAQGWAVEGALDDNVVCYRTTYIREEMLDELTKAIMWIIHIYKD